MPLYEMANHGAMANARYGFTRDGSFAMVAEESIDAGMGACSCAYVLESVDTCYGSLFMRIRIEACSSHEWMPLHIEG